MALLPNVLRSINADGVPQRGPHFVRVQALSPEARKLSEANWDRIIEENLLSLADAMREAEVIAEDSTLILVGHQVEAVDLVLAEVRKTHEDDDGVESESLKKLEPRRLVLLEDKLVRNPEAKRQVLAQLLDYAHHAQHDWNTDTLCRNADPEVATWLRLHAARVDVMLAQGDLLLVIAGDDIDQDLLRLARRFAASFDPLFTAELCLVSLALYRRVEEMLLVPHVVSAVERHQRQFSIRVTVTGPDGSLLPAQVERDEEADVAAARRGALPTNPDVEAFLRRLKAIVNPLLPPERFSQTGGERKVLAYWLDDEARLKVHFGGFVREAWSPIQVGLYVESVDKRDAWLARAQAAFQAGKLPADTKIRASGKKTVEALKIFQWTAPSELDDAMLDTVSKALLQFVEAFGSHQ